MRRSLLAVLIAAAACGGSPKSTTPPIPLPDDKPVAEKQPPAPEQPKEPAGPPIPQGPVEIPIPARQLEVKLVSAGKGKKAKLALTPKAGTKTTTELALDFSGGQDGPPETGGKMDQVAPTAVLTADVETQEVSTTGQTKFQIKFSGVAVKDRAGQKVNSDEFKAQIDALIGATILGTVGADGQMKDAKLRIEKPDQKTVGGLQFLALSMLPMWPVFPTEAVAPGAKWTVTSSEKVMDKFDITKVVTYELVGKKGALWTIKGTTAITGKDQTLDTESGPTRVGTIGGSGSHEITLADGTLLPTFKQNLATTFIISADVSDPKAPASAKPQTVEIKFHIEQANALTPKS